MLATKCKRAAAAPLQKATRPLLLLGCGRINYSRRRCSGSSALVLRRSTEAEPQGLAFELRSDQASQDFDGWAREHEAATDAFMNLTSFLRGALGDKRWTRQEGVAFDPYFVPFWAFLASPAGGGKEIVHKVYAGRSSFDTTALNSALTINMKALTAAQPFDSLTQMELAKNAGGNATVDEASVRVGAGWQAAVAEGADPEGLRAVALLYLPAWRVRYTCFGYPIDAWVCARTGRVGGLSAKALHLEVANQPLSGRFMQEFAASVSQMSPRQQQELISIYASAVGPMATAAVRGGIFVATRHPYVLAGTVAAGFAYTFARPLVDTLLRAVQQQLREMARKGSGALSDDSGAMDPELRADWEELLRRAQRRGDGASAAGEEDDEDCGAPDDVDWDDHRALLGLPADANLSRRQLDRAFRRELLRWHPDHNVGGQRERSAEERTRAIVHAYNSLKSRLWKS